MPFHSRVAASAFIVAVMAATVVLLAVGWQVGLALSERLDRPSAALMNVILALTPAGIVLAMGPRATPVSFVAAFATLIVVMVATVNLHAAVWIGAGHPPGSAGRVVIVLSALIWPSLAAGALALSMARRMRATPAGMTGGVGRMAWLPGHAALVWLVIRMLGETLPSWLMIAAVVSIVIWLQFVIESEAALLMLRRVSVGAPAAATRAKAEVDALTRASVEGPIVVDRAEAMTAEIRWRLRGRPVLILSAAMARLESSPLVAVIAHEYAHVVLGHLQIRLWLTIASSIVLGILIANLAPALGLMDGTRPVASFLVLAAALIGQRLLLHAYTRRQEREADQFAVSAVGADAMRTALELTSGGWVVPSAFTAWMTHDSMEARRRALDGRVR